MNRRPVSRTLPIRVVALLALINPALGAEQSAESSNKATPSADQVEITTSDEQFSQIVKPLLQQYCIDCHSGTEAEAMFDLSVFQSHQQVAEGFQVWEVLVDRIMSNEMPPADVDHQPSQQQRTEIANWFNKLKKIESDRTSGDPGEVLVRRLNHSEYNRTIRDLTGFDLRPTATFPIDPANPAGFDNTGESLTMSPALLNKYLAAARFVTEHLVLTPDSIAFAPHQVITDTDRDKYCVKRIINFYEHLTTDYGSYLIAAWKWKLLTQSDQTRGRFDSIEDFAANENLSKKYLTTIWNLLHQPTVDGGPINYLQTQWKQLPNAPESVQTVDRRCKELEKVIQQLRGSLTFEFPNIRIEGGNPGSQPFVLWKNRQYVKHRQLANLERLANATASTAGPSKNAQGPGGEESSQVASEQIVHGLLQLPEDESRREAIKKEFRNFCEVFPDAMYVSERGRDYVAANQKQDGEKGRLLSAGFHSMMGYFRDDQPLYDLMLDESQQRELDQLWNELNFISDAPSRQYSGFLWFDRTDSRYLRDEVFDFARPENRSASDESQIAKLGQLYREKAIASGAGDRELEAIDSFFSEINAQIRQVESQRIEAEPAHLNALIEFAAKAYRRPLTPSDVEELNQFYRQRREFDKLSHRESVEDTLVSILMSPYFCYHLELATNSSTPVRLSDNDLANRLSYLLWSSQPDDELLITAKAQELGSHDQVNKQTQRMIQDAKILGWATEFGGQWLDFRQFQSHNSVDRETFPQFNSSLRESMYQEPIRLLVHSIQNNRPVTELILGNDTFVNGVLAAHYGIEIKGNESGTVANALTAPPKPQSNQQAGDDWIHLQDARPYGRGGLLGMAVFQTKNSPGLRTSPVKRGYWVVKQLLGERIPPPPPNVPELPDNEALMGKLTLRESLALHREHTSCAGCHQRFDSIGLAFEGYGPVGERRTHDLGGRVIEIDVAFPGVGDETIETKGRGIEGLKEYMRANRINEFVDNLCRKLLSYSLGRSLQLSDERLVETMKRLATEKQAGFQDLLEVVISSEQFTNKRARLTEAETL